MPELLEDSQAEMPATILQKASSSASSSAGNAAKHHQQQNGHSHNHNHNGYDSSHSKVFDNGESTSISHVNGKWQPFLIGVAGGTASGKTSVCSRIMEKLGQADLEHKDRRVVTISADSFYRVLTEDEKKLARVGEFNFDHPDALDQPLIMNTMRTLLSGETVSIPVYDFVTHSRQEKEVIRVFAADVVLFEGILVFYFLELRDLFKLKLFVDMDADTRLVRRVTRDIKDRGRDLPSVLHQYTTFVKPAFEEFCLPTKKYADVIIPRGAENEVAINLIVQHIREHLLPEAKKNGSPRRSMQEEGLPVDVKS